MDQKLNVFVDPDEVVNFSKAINKDTRAIYIESMGNPKLDVLDIEAISKIAKKAKLPLIVDNTVATPYLLKPINYSKH
jgi:O-acetylhomoserine (thiol)-lyase